MIDIAGDAEDLIFLIHDKIEWSDSSLHLHAFFKALRMIKWAISVISLIVRLVFMLWLEAHMQRFGLFSFVPALAWRLIILDLSDLVVNYPSCLYRGRILVLELFGLLIIGFSWTEWR